MTSRLQLALNVTDLDAATAFYGRLFGAEPAKRRAGYANFEIADPPLKLVLFENADEASPLNHLGVEASSRAEVVDAAARFATAGLQHRVVERDRCCHAVQHKVWVDATDVPFGGWEFYAVVDDADHTQAGQPSACCGPAGAESSDRLVTTSEER
jgi:catechol 2,3-dioxygenase-like lactoylglutathione lyase family enzyme